MKPADDTQDPPDTATQDSEKKSPPKNEKAAFGNFFQGWGTIALFLILAGGISYGIWWGYGRWQKDQQAQQQPQQETGLASGHVIEKERLDDGLGLGSELLIDKRKGEPARVRFMLRDKDRKPIANATGQITFLQPGKPGSALTMPLKMDSPGVYRSDINLPEGGEWEVRAAVSIGENSFQTSKRVTLP